MCPGPVIAYARSSEAKSSPSNATTHAHFSETHTSSCNPYSWSKAAMQGHGRQMCHKMERQVQQENGSEKVPPELRPLRQAPPVQGQEQEVSNQA